MAIISDGTTNITLDFVDETYDPILDKSVRTSTAGRLKSQVAGERLQISAKARVTQAQYRSIMDLLNNGATAYFYTPGDNLTTYYANVTFPLEVDISKITDSFDNKKIFYIKFDVRSVSYI